MMFTVTIRIASVNYPVIRVGKRFRIGEIVHDHERVLADDLGQLFRDIAPELNNYLGDLEGVEVIPVEG